MTTSRMQVEPDVSVASMLSNDFAWSVNGLFDTLRQVGIARIARVHRGCWGGRKPIPVVITDRKNTIPNSATQHGNTTQNTSSVPRKTTCDIGLINCRSMCNKSDQIRDYISESKLDVIAHFVFIQSTFVLYWSGKLRKYSFMQWSNDRCAGSLEGGCWSSRSTPSPHSNKLWQSMSCSSRWHTLCSGYRPSPPCHLYESIYRTGFTLDSSSFRGFLVKSIQQSTLTLNYCLQIWNIRV